MHLLLYAGICARRTSGNNRVILVYLSVEYVVDILESFLGESRKHNEDSGQISFDCPACSNDKSMPEGDGKGNLEVNYYKDVFKCWVCKDTNNMYGGVTRLIKRFGNLKILADYRLLQPEKFQEDGEHQIKILELPAGYRELKDCNSKDFKYNRAMYYLLNDRGITQEIIEKFRIGYTTVDKFMNRIIIPSYDVDGILNYFIARWFDKQYTKLDYVNPDASKQAIIFNEYLINWDATIYIVEGGFDHIVTPNSIPLLGKYISDILLYELHERAQGNIVIMLDGDAYEDAKRLYYQLNFGKLTGRIRICKLPLDKDPSKLFKEQGQKGIIQQAKNAVRIQDELFSF